MSPTKKNINQQQKTKQVILEKGTRVIQAYKAGICSYCKKPFQRGEEFKWHPEQKLGYCPTCPSVPQFVLKEGKIVPFVKLEEKKFVPMQKVQRKPTKKEHAVEQKSLPTNEPIVAKDIFDGKYAFPFRLQNNPDRAYVVFHVKTFSDMHKFKEYRIIMAQHENAWLNVALIKPDNTLQKLGDYKFDPTLSHVKMKVIELLVEKLVVLDDDTLAGYGLLYTKVTKKCWSCSKAIDAVNEKQHGLCDTCFNQLDADITDVRTPTFVLPF